MARQKILVLSDLHMIDTAPSIEASSWLSSLPRYETNKHNPLRGVKDILDHTDNIDFVFCPGDLGDQHNATTQNLAWRMLNELKEHLHARHLFGTVGNHDVDSRRVEGGILPWESIKSIETFPHRSTDFNNQFWANGFAVYEDSDSNIAIIVVNSSCFHGIEAGTDADGNLNDAEWRRGKLSEGVLGNLEAEIGRLTATRAILMLHHHINPSDAMDDDVSVISNAGDFLEALTAFSGQLLIIHGHLHKPELLQRPLNNIVGILSSGSAGGKPWPHRSTGLRPQNQFHVIEIDDSDNLCGTIESWNWLPSKGWIKSHGSSIDSSLPKITGFGAQMTSAALYGAISAAIEHGIELNWAEITVRFPDVRLLGAEDHETLINQLTDNGLSISFERDGTPQKIKRSANG